jgi:hypothetical protein
MFGGANCTSSNATILGTAGHEYRLLAGTRSTRMAAIWQANFERQICGIETGFT